ncbi:MAG: shikimate kinase [Eubacteriales bacterium]|nr:shikimate kinase [Eubacteriales bacterium]
MKKELKENPSGKKASGKTSSAENPFRDTPFSDNPSGDHRLKDNIFLIGFMGTGKSTIADCLHTLYGMDVVEMDREIEEQEGMGIPDIFEKYGEEYFRNAETALLYGMQGRRNTVISCGGGVPLREQNVSGMKKSGHVVLLTAGPETILQRVRDSHDRPLLENNKTAAFIADMMEKRREKYEAAADIVVETDGRDAPRICREILCRLRLQELQRNTLYN